MCVGGYVNLYFQKICLKYLKKLNTFVHYPLIIYVGKNSKNESVVEQYHGDYDAQDVKLFYAEGIGYIKFRKKVVLIEAPSIYCL